MKKFIIYTFLAALAGPLTGCGCEYHLRKARKKCESLTQSDTVFKTIEKIVPRVHKDTIFNYLQTDTVIIKEGQLTMKYFYNTITKEVYLDGKCDTVKIKVKVPVVVNKTTYKSRAVNWNWLLTALIAVAGCVLIFRQPTSKRPNSQGNS